MELVSILIATVVAMAIGMFWYSPAGFGNAWIKEMGFSKAEVKKMQKACMRKPMAMEFVGKLLMAYVLSMFVAGTAMESMETATWLWLGLVVPMSLSAYAWEKKSSRLLAINASCALVTLAAMAAVLVLW